MIDFFSNMHIWLQRRIEVIAGNPSFVCQIYARFYVALDYLCKGTVNIFLPLYFRFTKSKALLHNSSKDVSVVVSLTTFPKRIGRVWMVIESLMRQKVMPAEIHLWLSLKQFSGEDDLPNNLKREIRKGLQVHFMEEDIRSHKKYYYILQSHPEDMIVTVDDDIIYRSDAIQTLLRYHEKYPESVIANYSRKIRKNINGDLVAYDTWKQQDEEGIDDSIFFGSGGGTLFPPHVLHAEVTNIKAIMKCCPTADDIWLNAMTRLNKRRIIKTDCSKVFLPLWIINDIALSKTDNDGINGNDKQLRLVREYCVEKYGIDPFANN